MDLGSMQWKWVNDLKISQLHPSSIIESQEHFIIPDHLHLLKNHQNNFQHKEAKDMEYEPHGTLHTAKWTYIKLS